MQRIIKTISYMTYIYIHIHTYVRIYMHKHIYIYVCIQYKICRAYLTPCWSDVLGNLGIPTSGSRTPGERLVMQDTLHGAAKRVPRIYIWPSGAPRM